MAESSKTYGARSEVVLRSAPEGRFRRVLGSSPRKFASIVRLRHVLRLRYRGGTSGTLTRRIRPPANPIWIYGAAGRPLCAVRVLSRQEKSRLYRKRAFVW
jgi:hypothetical protein